MLEQNEWFTEIIDGCAFSLRVLEKCHEETTPYQKIEIFETETFGMLMVIDGCIMLSDRDNFIYHEMMTHPAMYTHPDPRRVWIIGGGDCGSLREVLKHERIESAVQIEIDERVTRLAERYFPTLCEANSDPRADLRFIDGIEWVKNAEPGSVDIIIVDSTDPVGPAEGLFNEAFYRNCRRCLGEQGILVQQSESPILHMELLGGMRSAMTAAGFAEAKTLFFPQTVYPSGWWSATLAGQLDGFREEDARKKKFATDYYNSAIHRAALTAPEFFRRALER